MWARGAPCGPPPSPLGDRQTCCLAGLGGHGCGCVASTQTFKTCYTLLPCPDVLSGPNILVCGADQEALWWEAFAEVYAEEVSEQ